MSRRTLVAVLAILLMPACGQKKEEAPATFAQAAAAIADKKWHPAIGTLKVVLQKEPDNAEARFLLGSVYNQVGDFGSAEKELQRARDLGLKKGGRVSVELGRALMRNQEFKKITTELESLPEFEPDLAASVFGLRGRAFLALGQLEQAREMAAAGAKLSETSAQVLLLRSWIAAHAKDGPAAMSFSSLLVERYPELIEGLINHADLLRISGDYAAALDVYGRILKLEPYYVPTYMARASLYMLQNKPGDAQRDLDAVMQFTRDNPQVRLTQTVLLLQWEKYEDAKRMSLYLGRDHPNYRLGNLAAACTHYIAGELRQAESYVKRYVYSGTPHPFGRELLAMTRKKIEDARSEGGGAGDDVHALLPDLAKEFVDAALPALAGTAYHKTPDFARATDPLEQAAWPKTKD